MILRKSTLLHLRIPFSLFLLPVFLFALSQSKSLDTFNFFLVFFILHLLIYPASNGYNSYYDKDEDSIGGLEKPPEVSKELLYTSLLLDVFALGLGALISWEFVIMLFLYGLASKAYSHDKVRLKKHPVAGWLTATFFQGAFTYLIVYMAINNIAFSELFSSYVLIPALVSSLMIGGFYPMTQIYQHKEDGKRGDVTLSRKLGIRGTFIFSGFMFILSDVGFSYYFLQYYSGQPVLLFHAFLLPLLLYFLSWFFKVIKDESQANFKYTMLLNKVSSACMIGFFVMFYFLYN